MWGLIREPNTLSGEIRISLGFKPGWVPFLIFRGDPSEVVEVLESALEEARIKLPRGGYEDNSK